jgi:hypothetical protein
MLLLEDGREQLKEVILECEGFAPRNRMKPPTTGWDVSVREFGRVHRSDFSAEFSTLL